MAVASIANAHAASSIDASSATYCSVTGSPNTGGIRLDDVTFSGNTPTAAADDCFGVIGGDDSQTAINSLGLNWGSDWEFLVRDGEAGSFGGLDYSLSLAGAAQGSGTWTLTASPVELLPVNVDFIAALKVGDSFALWYFNDVRVGGNDGGAWSSYLSSSDALLPLSHFSLYVRNESVPEPGTLALLGLGLAGLGFTRRRTAV